MGSQSCQMRLSGTMAVFAGYAGLDPNSQGSRRNVTAKASLFQIRCQYTAQPAFIIRRLLLRKPSSSDSPFSRTEWM